MGEAIQSDFESAYNVCCESNYAKPRKRVISQLFPEAGEISQPIESKDDAEGESESKDGKADEGRNLILPGNCLEFFNNRLQVADVQSIVSAVVRCKIPLKELDLSYNFLDDQMILALIDLFENSKKTLKKINLSNNAISCDGLSYIISFMNKNTVVTELNLNGNPLGPGGGMDIADMIKNNNYLKTLDIGNTEQDTESIIAIATAMRKNTGITSLNLDNPRLVSLGEETTIHIARMLQINTTLRSLSLVKHKIRCYGAARLAEHLERNDSLRSIDLKSNMIQMEGAKAFSVLLLNTKSLTDICLKANQVQDEGACALGGVLQYNSTLQSIDLSGNAIKDKGLCAIAHGLSKNSSINRLFLWGNKFGESSSKLFYDLNMGRFKLYDFVLDFKPYIAEPGEPVQIAQVDVETPTVKL